MRIVLFVLLFGVIGCPKKEPKSLADIEREEALEELMNKDDDEFSEDFPEEDSEDMPDE